MSALGKHTNLPKVKDNLPEKLEYLYVLSSSLIPLEVQDLVVTRNIELFFETFLSWGVNDTSRRRSLQGEGHSKPTGIKGVTIHPALVREHTRGNVGNGFKRYIKHET